MTLCTLPLRQRQRGISLIEALVAFLVLCIGMLAAARMQPWLRQHSELARQRSEAVRLAQQDIERLRAFAVMPVTTGVPSYDGIANGGAVIDDDAGALTSTRYQLTRNVDALGTPNAKQVSVMVSWAERSGVPQQVTLNTLVAAGDPALAGALTLAPRGVAVKGAAGRSADIPLAAKDLGDDSSVFKPVVGGVAALLFDNRTGQVSARCTVSNPALATRDLAATDLSACTRLSGMLLSGQIRLTSATPPSTAQANDAPLSLEVTVALAGGTSTIAPWCGSEAMKSVAITGAGGLRLEAVPLDALPASLGVSEWQDRGERFVAYHCVIVPPAGTGQWSGRSTLVPAGWTIGTTAGAWRVCRFSSDLDGSGAIDANIEHPPIYQNVDIALKRQNFLVIRGTETCPASAATDLANPLATAAHQS
jgi:Tfp pilus assembly protein PilV